tara:strand:- start:16 stop:297 length:282 start_codon:yes stop_codon:yes gene_type:complete
LRHIDSVFITARLEGGLINAGQESSQLQSNTATLLIDPSEFNVLNPDCINIVLLDGTKTCINSVRMIMIIDKGSHNGDRGPDNKRYRMNKEII